MGQITINWGLNDGIFIFAITSTLLGYYAYYYLGHHNKVKDWFLGRYISEKFWIRWTLYQKFLGFLFMAIVPMTIYVLLFDGSFTDFGLNWYHVVANWYWLGGIPLFFIFVCSQLARRQKIQLHYPQMRISNWTIGRFVISASGWIIYLIAYEYLFRGLLLFSSIEAFGIWPAIAINVAIYSAVHLPKGVGETLGAIPFGILSCIITISTGTILIPVFAHIGLAVSMEFFAIKHNPEMRFIKSGGNGL